jgi:hypothetical protein
MHNDRTPSEKPGRPERHDKPASNQARNGSHNRDIQAPHLAGADFSEPRGHRRRRTDSAEHPERTPPRPSKDISAVVKGWDYEPGVINVRKVEGLDGTPKLQMRLDLGLLQMELEGRPDGQRPHECESLLDYHHQQLQDHQQRNGTELGFHLSVDECQLLREEAAMYYRRYLSLFVLGDFPAVVRDTIRNLRVLDLCGKFAVDESDRLLLEQYRPYLLMMRTKAQASIELQARKLPQALETVRRGMEGIRAFFDRFDQEDAYAQCSEVALLEKFAEDIRQMLPGDPLGRLQMQLHRAIRAEQYEEAARLRDEIRNRQDHMA